MESALTNNKKSLLSGLFLQFPVLLVALSGVLYFLGSFALSFTNANPLNKPQFVGLDNYAKVFSTGYRIVVNNSITYMLVVFIFCIGTITAALFISKLKTIFGILGGALLSVFSFSAIFPSFVRVMFSGDSYGYINSVFMSLGLLKEPVAWFEKFGSSIYLVFAVAAITAPIFIITYIFAKNGKKTLGVMTAVCAMPILFAGTSGISISLLGYPAPNYADWFPLVIRDGYQVCYELGKTSALWVVAAAMFFVWCALCCGIIFLMSKALKRIKLPQVLTKIVGYVLFAATVLKTILFVLPNVTYVVNGSFKPVDELVLFPPSIFVKRPTFSNYTTILGEQLFSSLSDVWIILLFCVITIIPSAIGFALLKNPKVKKWLSFLFVPCLAFMPFCIGFPSSVAIRLGSFFTSVGAVAVFLVTYYLTKSVTEAHKYKAIKIISGAFCVITTVFCMGMANINFDVTIPNQINWLITNRLWATNGVARAGVAFAGDVLLGLFTIASVLVPIVLFMVSYFIGKSKKVKGNK